MYQGFSKAGLKHFSTLMYILTGKHFEQHSTKIYMYLNVCIYTFSILYTNIYHQKKKKKIIQ